MENVVDKLIDFSGGKDEELRDISGLGKIVYRYEAVFETSLWRSFEDHYSGAAA